VEVNITSTSGKDPLFDISSFSKGVSLLNIF